MVGLQLAKKQANNDSYIDMNRHSYVDSFEMPCNELDRDEKVDEFSQGQRISNVSVEFISWQSEQVV